MKNQKFLFIKIKVKKNFKKKKIQIKIYKPLKCKTVF